MVSSISSLLHKKCQCLPRSCSRSEIRCRHRSRNPRRKDTPRSRLRRSFQYRTSTCVSDRKCKRRRRTCQSSCRSDKDTAQCFALPRRNNRATLCCSYLPQLCCIYLVRTECIRVQDCYLRKSGVRDQ